MKKIIVALTFALRYFSAFAEVPDKPLLKIFDAAYRSAPSSNLLISPWGIQECYGMVSAGAGKVSSAELDKLLKMWYNLLTNGESRKKGKKVCL